MANRARPTLKKRTKEKARQDKQKRKAERRLQAKTQRDSAGPQQPGEDPDIAGILPGPQPPLEE